VSTPTSLELPDGVRRTTIHTGRGPFAALEATPASGVCERETALLVPGYTGSKEDFLAILDLLADGGRQVVAIDMRGQFETPGADDPDGYSASALGSDIVAIIHATGAGHLVGHSYGGLIAREAMLADAGHAGAGLIGTGLAGTRLTGTASRGDAGTRLTGTGSRGDAGTRLTGTGSRGDIRSFTLMSSGPAALTGPRARQLRAMLAALGASDGSMPDTAALQASISELWQAYLEPESVAAGVPGHIVAFLAKRMLSNDPNALVLMARHMLTAADRTAELARLGQIPMLVIYGENDNSWSPAAQENMARRLGARRLCIPAAMHSPAVEAPATTAIALTQFWDAAESTAKHATVTGTA
jgi:pimeloyl-ACP methyl ester carboxylesterase